MQNHGPAFAIHMLVGLRHPASSPGAAHAAFLAAQETPGHKVQTLFLYDGAPIRSSCFIKDLEEQQKKLLDRDWVPMSKDDLHLCLYGMSIPNTPFWLEKHTPLATAIKQADLNTKKGIIGAHISPQGMFTYLNNMPTLTLDVQANINQPNQYTIPRNGDVLLNIIIKGNINKAKIYQYDVLGHKKMIYDEAEQCTEAIFTPFPTGIPLQQVGKPIYLDVYGENIQVTATYAFLDDTSRKQVGTYHDDEWNGVILKHHTGTIYKVYNIHEHSYSPNVLAPIS